MGEECVTNINSVIRLGVYVNALNGGKDSKVAAGESNNRGLIEIRLAIERDRAEHA